MEYAVIIMGASHEGPSEPITIINTIQNNIEDARELGRFLAAAEQRRPGNNGLAVWAEVVPVEDI